MDWPSQRAVDRNGPTLAYLDQDPDPEPSQASVPVADWYWEHAPALVAAAAGYFVLGRLGLELSLVGLSVTPVWLPTGIAVAVFLGLGARAWPVVLVPALLVNLSTGDPAVWAAALIAIGNTVAPGMAAMALRRYGFDWNRRAGRDALLLIGVALVAMAVSAAVGSFALLRSDVITQGSLGTTWLTWWTGDTMGVLGLTPVLLGLSDLKPSALNRRRLIEVGALSFLLVVATAWAATSQTPRLYMLVPAVGFMAWRLETTAAAIAALVTMSVVGWSAARGRGSFMEGSVDSSMLTIQGFNVVVALSSLFFAAMVAEQRRAAVALARTGTELEGLVRQATSELTASNVRLTEEIVERRTAQETARLQALALAEAQSVARIGSWSWDVEEDRVEWSQELHRIYGVDPASFEATYKGYEEYVHPADRVRVQRSVNEAARRGGPFEFEHRIIRPDGDTRIILSQGIATLGPDRRPIRMVGTAQDITDRRQAERLEWVERERRRLEEIFVRAPAAVMLTRGPDHLIEYANPAFILLLGPRPFNGQPVAKAFPELLDQGYCDLLAHVFSSGETFTAPESAMEVGDAGRQREIFLNVTFQPLRDSGGDVEGVLVYAFDVTETVSARTEVERMAEEVGRMYERELHVTGVLQRSLLPDRLPQVDGLELVGRYAPGSYEAEVGGDWYDALVVPGDQLVVMIGDVEGHGVEAAATMGQLRNALRAYLIEGTSPAEAIDRLRVLARETGDDRFATVLCMSFDPVSRRATVASAGHLPILVSDVDRSTRLVGSSTGPPIGAPIRGPSTESRLDLDAGLSLLLYTDGLVERRGEDLSVGLERLRRCVEKGPPDADGMADWLMQELGSDRHDDIALIALRLTR